MSKFTLQSNIPQLTRQLRSRGEQIVSETAFGIEGRIKTSMAEPKSGIERKGHVASAPGEAPAIDTSLLVNSIQVSPEGPSLEKTVGTNVEYAAALEFGSVTIESRPAWEPAFEAEASEFEKKLKGIFE